MAGKGQTWNLNPDGANPKPKEALQPHKAFSEFLSVAENGGSDLDGAGAPLSEAVLVSLTERTLEGDPPFSELPTPHEAEPRGGSLEVEARSRPLIHPQPGIREAEAVPGYLERRLPTLSRVRAVVGPAKAPGPTALGGGPFSCPSFTQEPQDVTFPLDLSQSEITLSCAASGHPRPHYRWRHNGTDLDFSTSSHYRLEGGSLVIGGPHPDRDVGTYQCLATNPLGTVLSRQAALRFAYIEDFETRARSAVSVREGQGVVLLCGPPPHSGDLSYAWAFNDSPLDVQEDGRRFVSQETGNLYIAKVEPSDVGNYTCSVTNERAQRSVRGPPTPLVQRPDGVMGEYEPKIEVRFPDPALAAKGSSVKLECFALGNPVPDISWRRLDGSPLPGKVKYSKSQATLEIPNFQQEDEGFYECTAGNPRGRNRAKGHLLFYAPPEWERTIQNAHLSVYGSLHWECRARGRPRPWYRWLKNGEPLRPQERIQIENGTLIITVLNVSDSGVYQCAAENKYQIIYANAELRVLASAPDFSKNPIKRNSVVHVGGDAAIECRPQAFPRATVSWRRGAQSLRQSGRVSVSEDGSLKIHNVTRSDAGPYTCIASNQFGVAKNTGSLIVKERTVITVPPSPMDVAVGESIVLPCQVSRDPSVEVAFAWSFNEHAIDEGKAVPHFERIGGESVGDLMIRNIQLSHSGKYLCTVRTALETLSAAAEVIVRGPPGPPQDVRVDLVSSTTSQVSWRPGADNNSPVQAFAVQARTPFSVGWQAVSTVPEILGGQTFNATVVGLSPWVDYEFRVVAGNSVGIGEPSRPSGLFRTKASVPAVAPANIHGGGGSRTDLVITWEPVPEELQSGGEFGYLVMLRPVGAAAWTTHRVPAAESCRFVYRNESVSPLSPFEVRVGVYNSEGDGALSAVAIIYSGEDEPQLAPRGTSAQSFSASEMEVSWTAIAWNRNAGRVLGYEVLYWTDDSREPSTGQVRVSGNVTAKTIRGLKANTVYFASVRAYNTGGAGPSSPPVNVTTKKSPPSQPPANIAWKLTDSKLCLNWEHVRTMENESEVLGYKILYRHSRQSETHVLETNATSAELLVPRGEDYLVEIRAVSDGGDGSSSAEIRIPRVSSLSSAGVPVSEPGARFPSVAAAISSCFALCPLVRRMNPSVW
ncbi:contactin-6 [Artibeus jamaicensis]|uniref:contactin-6 n=1 Tax=Artibeus jamaicensis TaxID=9417 RepID=UPI00235AFDFA|nr:contactin-6 [Artibeus jamaicensis]